MRISSLFKAVALVASVYSLDAAAQQRRAGDFDFYVLALSWSPSYCEVEGGRANRQQCASGREYDFVVHGLWPQYERGFPRECRTGERRVSDRIVRSMLDIMPSGGLVGHQWRMHGTCSGQGQQEYFDTVRAAFEKNNDTSTVSGPAAGTANSPLGCRSCFHERKSEFTGGGDIGGLWVRPPARSAYLHDQVT